MKTLNKFLLACTAIIVLLPLVVISGLYLLSERLLHDVQIPPPFTQEISADKSSIERGRHIARTRGCLGCHGQQLEGKDFDEQWDWPQRAVAPNLARYAREHAPTTIERAVRHGIGSSGRALISMPSYNFRRLADADMAALIAFLQTAPVIENPLPGARLGWRVRWDFLRGVEKHMAYWATLVPELRADPSIDPSLARGEYLALTMCNECHGLDVRGESFYAAIDGGRPTPDLAMVIAYSRDDFEKFVRTGIASGERRVGLMSLVAPDRYVDLSAEELDDLYRYLTSLAQRPRTEHVPWRP